MHPGRGHTDGDLAVFIEEGDRLEPFDLLCESVPQTPGEVAHFENDEFHLDEVLPDTDRYWSYEGSLTTPPCAESVHWLILDTAMSMAADQIAAFTELFPDNSRPVQPLHGRAVHLRAVIQTD